VEQGKSDLVQIAARLAGWQALDFPAGRLSPRQIIALYKLSADPHSKARYGQILEYFRDANRIGPLLRPGRDRVVAD
jgi:hypothetical protein